MEYWSFQVPVEVSSVTDGVQSCTPSRRVVRDPCVTGGEESEEGPIFFHDHSLTFSLVEGFSLFYFRSLHLNSAESVVMYIVVRIKGTGSPFPGNLGLL